MLKRLLGSLHYNFIIAILVFSSAVYARVHHLLLYIIEFAQIGRKAERASYLIMQFYLILSQKYDMLDLFIITWYVVIGYIPLINSRRYRDSTVQIFFEVNFLLEYNYTNAKSAKVPINLRLILLTMIAFALVNSNCIVLHFVFKF